MNVKMQHMDSAARPYRGQSAERRRADRRARLIAATRELLREVGWGRTSLRAICAQAGLADRYFYESFPDRDALLAAVLDEVVEEAVTAIAARVLAAPPEPQARARVAVDAFLGLLEAEPGFARVALFETPDSPVVHRHRRAALRRFAQFIAEQIKAISGPDAHTPLDRELTAHALIGAFQELLIAHDEGELAVTREQLIEHAAALAQAAGTVTSARPSRRPA